jgi:hypothetical protein
MLHALKGATAKGQIVLAAEELSREANFLLGIIQSLCVLGRAGSSRETLDDVISSALKRFG